MSFDSYVQIIFSTIVPAIIAIIAEIIFSNQKVKKKYVFFTFGIWLLVFIIITVIYFFTEQGESGTIEDDLTNKGIIANANDAPSETITSNSSNQNESTTTTSIDSSLDDMLVAKVDKLVAPSNPVKHDIQIIFSINSSGYPEEEIEIYNNDKEKELLYKAKELCENRNYDEAITIYVCDELKDNPYAQVNIGYLYAHGYGYDEDVEAALNIYDSIDMDIAKRNKLALLITSNKDGKNDAEIKNLIDYFVNKNDYYVQNYITNCIYCKNVEALNDREKNIICNLKDLYILELAGKINSTHTYNLNHAYKKLIYTGLTYDLNENYTTSAYYHYDVFQYMYLDWLEKIYA